MNLFGDDAPRPWADRLRPTQLADFVGQDHVTGPGQLIRTIIEQKKPMPLILWGPPGSGKTTLARMVADSSGLIFEEISAVTSGLPDVKKVIERAKERRRTGQGTLLFVDEIHRFNKAQQDAFLPHMESGLITLIGATTENPSFEVIGPLLSRSRVVVLGALKPPDLEKIINRTVKTENVKIDLQAVKLLATMSAGDARVALSGLELAANLGGTKVTVDLIKQALQQPTTKYDKGGEYHYNLISAYIKSIRGGAVDAALYYMARMLAGGEDPKFIARRLVILASEDIGLANNSMLPLAVATFQAVERIGLPEARLNLSHATIALSLASKSRAACDALSRAERASEEHPISEPPLHLRNAPTKLMKELDYGKDYHWEPGFVHPEGFLPPDLQGERFWRDDTEPEKPAANNAL